MFRTVLAVTVLALVPLATGSSAALAACGGGSPGGSVYCNPIDGCGTACPPKKTTSAKQQGHPNSVQTTPVRTTRTTSTQTTTTQTVTQVQIMPPPKEHKRKSKRKRVAKPFSFTAVGVVEQSVVATTQQASKYAYGELTGASGS